MSPRALSCNARTWLDANFLLCDDAKRIKFLHESTHNKLCWFILRTRSWFMERDVAVEFFKLNFWALCAPQAERHLVPLYQRLSRHLHRLYVQNSAAHTKTIQTDEQHHRSEFGVSCLLNMAATSDYFYHLFGHKMPKMQIRLLTFFSIFHSLRKYSVPLYSVRLRVQIQKHNHLFYM